ALEPLCHDLLAYVDEIEQHMAKEESGIFVHALDVLSEADHDELTRAFENVDSEDSEEGAVEYYEGLAQDLTSYGT
ncbi:MAG TPA: hypothetical protein PK838_08995, partial [Thermoleophilia bacterium]|nr:hypothetical protein [Thermoleophilia bacterium]